jgi:hypothetical protein
MTETTDYCQKCGHQLEGGICPRCFPSAANENDITASSGCVFFDLNITCQRQPDCEVCDA